MPATVIDPATEPDIFACLVLGSPDETAVDDEDLDTAVERFMAGNGGVIDDPATVAFERWDFRSPRFDCLEVGTTEPYLLGVQPAGVG